MKHYHLGFGQEDLGNNPPQIALLSGEPERSRYLAQTYLQNVRLFRYRTRTRTLRNLQSSSQWIS